MGPGRQEHRLSCGYEPATDAQRASRQEHQDAASGSIAGASWQGRHSLKGHEERHQQAGAACPEHGDLLQGLVARRKQGTGPLSNGC